MPVEMYWKRILEVKQIYGRERDNNMNLKSKNLIEKSKILKIGRDNLFHRTKCFVRKMKPR